MAIDTNRGTSQIQTTSRL